MKQASSSFISKENCFQRDEVRMIFKSWNIRDFYEKLYPLKFPLSQGFQGEKNWKIIFEEICIQIACSEVI